ncbi:MAG: hypothetical protein WC379_09835 [Methanoregula sp.]|jgi:hypothetical protein
MGLFDDLGKALKQVENEVKKAELEHRAKQAGTGTNQPAAAQPAHPATGRSASRSPHPGYQKLAAWMKRNYKDRILGSGDSFQKGLELEQLTAEACRELPAKAKIGFMDYLKKQNYEPLLK